MLRRGLQRFPKPQTLLGLWLLFFSSFCAGQDLPALANEYLAGYWKAWPSLAATPAGVHTYDRELEDLTPQALQQEITRLRSFITRLEKLDEKALSKDARLDRGLLLEHLHGALLDLEESRVWQTRPQDYVTLAGRSVLALAHRQFASPGVRFAAAAARLHLLPRWLRQARLNLENPPEIATRRALELLPAAADYLETGIVQAASEQGLDKKALSRLQKETHPAVQALRDFGRWMEQDLLPRSKGNPVLGAERLAKRFRDVLGVTQTPDQALAAAEASLVETRRELSRVTLQSFPPLRPEEALGACREAAARARKFVAGKRWAPVPQPDRLQFETAPAFLDLNGPSLDPAGPFESGLAYFSYLPEASITEREAQVAGIEYGYPGEYVQRAALSLASDVVRKVFPRRTFLAGWGPYAVQLMIEEGFSTDVRRAIGLELEAIVDIRLHTGGLGAAEAVNMLVEQAHVERDFAERTVRYALLHPGELSSYYIGKMELLALRDQKRKEWAPGFNLREFHQFLLGTTAF